MVVFTYEMKQELPNIMINRFTFVINLLAQEFYI